MPLMEFSFHQGDAGTVVMRAPGIAVAFCAGRGLGHALYVDSRSGEPAGGPEDWLVRSADSSEEGIQADQGRRIENPVYQELVPHEFHAGSSPGLCALLTGSSLNHHFSAVFSLYRDAETLDCIVLDVDVADRCRGPVEKLAATYLVSGKSLGGEPRQSSPTSLQWQGEAPHSGRIELIAIPLATVDRLMSPSGDVCAQILARIDPESHTQRLRYRWRWASNSVLTR